MEKLLIKKWMMLLALVMCFSVNAFAQSILVSGTVFSSEDGEPIIGANVMVKGTGIGAVTDLDGKFTLIVPVDTTLVISYVGHVTKEVKVKKDLKIILQSESPILSFFTTFQKVLFYERMIPLKDDMGYYELWA